MTDYLYTPLELAIIIRYHKMNAADYTEMLHNIFRYDNARLAPGYQHDERKLMLDVMDKLNNLSDRRRYECEQEEIARDMAYFGLSVDTAKSEVQYTCSHLVFKDLRLRITYININRYAKIKLRTLLNQLGYKRRSSRIMEYIFECLWVYGILATYDGVKYCDLESIHLDETIVFKVVTE